jgi:hypothetical protein
VLNGLAAIDRPLVVHSTAQPSARYR